MKHATSKRNVTEITVGARVSNEVSDLINEILAEEKVDRSTVVRRLLDMGVGEWRISGF